MHVKVISRLIFFSLIWIMLSIQTASVFGKQRESTVKIRLLWSSVTQQDMSYMAGVGAEKGDVHVCF